MEPSITVQVFDREMKAAVRELPPGCSIETIRRALAQEKIICGIDWDAIKDAIARADESGRVLTNVTIATAEEAAPSVRYGKTGPVFSGKEVERLHHNLTAVGKAMRTDDAAVALADAAFVNAGETALTVSFGTKRRNVYGEEIAVSCSGEPLLNEASITEKPLPDGYQLIAKATGYLVINESNVYDIYDTFFASADRLTLFCRILPLVYGRQSFIEKVIRTVAAASISGELLQKIMTNPHLEKLELRKGRPPVPGRPGSITFLITPNPEPKEQTLERIDYHDTGRFREVDEGTVIAEAIPMIQSIPGVDVFGEAISAETIGEINFTCGDGITRECMPDLIRFIARERGILELNDHYVNVTPQLTINGDVCSEIGNIAYSRAVIVNGTVCAGFRIVCGNLTVRDSIEDGAEILCSGQLSVNKGIFGERTRVTVSGDARIGLIQGASLRVQGDCIIEEYAYHARIFCGGILHINGKGLTGREKGCVIGGDVSCMNTLDLHSVGSTATLTTLSCGFDPEGFEAYKETVTLEKTLKKKIVQLQNRIHFNPNDKVLMLQRLQNAGAEQKETFRQALQELRTTIALAEKAGASVALLARKTVAADISRSKILIRNQLIPPTLIVFGNIKKKIYRESFGVRFSKGADEIVMYEGLAAINGDCGNTAMPEAAARRSC